MTCLVQILPKSPIVSFRINPLIWLIKPFMFCLNVHFRPHITSTSFSALTKLNCFQFLQQVMQTLNSRFLHRMPPLSGTHTYTPNTHIHAYIHTHTQPGQFLLVHKGRNHICLLTIGIQCLLPVSHIVILVGWVIG